MLTKVLRTMARNDVRLIGRDSFLTGMIVMVLATAVILRFFLPWLENTLAQQPELGIGVADYYPMVISYLVFLGSILSGVVVGFILLDERDDNTLKALLVTPLPLPYYIAYRVVVPMALAFVVGVLDILIVNQSVIPVWQLVPIVAVGALTAPAATLFFGGFAENKVQGFALVKILGAIGMLLVAAWFVPEPLQFLFGLFPPYWVAKAYWLAYAGNPNWLLALVLGFGLMLGLIALLTRRFRAMAYR